MSKRIQDTSRKYSRENETGYVLDAVQADITNFMNVVEELTTRTALRRRDLARLDDVREVEVNHALLLLDDVGGVARIKKLLNDVLQLTTFSQPARRLSGQRRQIEDLVYANEKCHTILWDLENVERRGEDDEA